MARHTRPLIRSRAADFAQADGSCRRLTKMKSDSAVKHTVSERESERERKRGRRERAGELGPPAKLPSAVFVKRIYTYSDCRARASFWRQYVRARPRRGEGKS